MIRAVVAIVVVASSGCTEHVQLGDHGAIPGLVSLEVSPATTVLAIDDLSQPAQTVTYTATGTFIDGSTRDVTSLVDWTTDNDAPGAFAMPGEYRTSNTAAGHVDVIASSDDISGSAALTVTVTLTIVDDVFPPPPGADAILTSDLPVVSADPMKSPVVTYPANDTMFPQGLARILIQYTGGMNNDAFSLSFDSDVLHLVVFTGSDRWQPDDAIWALVERSTAGASVGLTMRAIDSAAATAIYTNPSSTLAFATAQPDGSIDFFSASTNGVMRGLLDATSASKLYPPSSDTTCVGCHAVARDGSAMAFGYGGPTLDAISLPSLATQISPAAKLPMGWATWSPDADRLLVASHGMLTLYDAAGTSLGKVPLPPGMLATHPDWSPDGASIVVALVSMIDPMDMDVKGGSIAVLPYAGGAWGPLTVLVHSTSDTDNNFFPRWSPDGRAIAFVHAASSSRGAATAELRLVGASGGAPTALRLASHRVGGVDDVPNLADTMPTWVVATGNIQWLAFATTRPYGLIRPGMGPSQIWLAGVDVAQLASDPSFAAFWLPCQDITVVNNDPVWAPTAITTTDAQNNRAVRPSPIDSWKRGIRNTSSSPTW